MERDRSIVYSSLCNAYVVSLGVDRHLYGIRKTLQLLNSGGKCQPKLPLPSIYTDEAWKKSGGDGNFLLSTRYGIYISIVRIRYSSVSSDILMVCMDMCVL